VIKAQRETHSAGGEVILMCRTADGAGDLVASKKKEGKGTDHLAAGFKILDCCRRNQERTGGLTAGFKILESCRKSSGI
jgi:hypothetical protein